MHRIGRTGRAGRAGTAISIVTSLDNKSLAAIEKLIGQTIPRAEGDYTVHTEASDETDQPREHRSREGSRGGRKPRREREPRHTKSGEKNGERAPRHAKGAGRSADVPAAAAQPSAVPSIGRPEPRRAQREVESEPADHSHLPAFLLRPVRARV